MLEWGERQEQASVSWTVKSVRWGDKVNGFKPIGKGWIVERAFSWYDNYRRSHRNDELTFSSS